MAKRKPIHKNYKHEGGFVGLPRRVFESDEYAGLSLKARCLLDELQNLHRPQRNGRIGLSVDVAAKRMRSARKRAQTAFDELEEKGFIEESASAYWRNGKAREWRLTYEPCNGREPTNDWKQ